MVILSLVYGQIQYDSPCTSIFVTLFNPVPRFSCVVNVWVELKACKWLCLSQLHSLTFRLFLINEIVK